MADNDLTSPGAAELGEFDENRKYNALTPQEKQLTDQVMIHGFDYLLVVMGWTLAATRDFLQRAEVKRYIMYHQNLYLSRQSLQERTQFYSAMKLQALVPTAIGVLTRALIGTKVRDDGSVEVRAPDRGQFDAAVEVLTRANIKADKLGTDMNTPLVDARSVTINVNDAVKKVGGLTPQARQRVAKQLKRAVEFLNTGGAAEAGMSPETVVPDDDGEEAPAAPKNRPRGPAPRDE